MLNASRVVAIDTETTGLYWWRDQLYAISFSDGKAAWVCAGAWLQPALMYAQAILRNPEWLVIGHNIKFDLHFLGMPSVAATIFDTMVGLFLLNENEDNDLKSAVLRIFKYRMRSFKDTCGRVTEDTGNSRTRRCQVCKCTKSRMPTCETCHGTGVESVARQHTRMRRIDEIPTEELAAYAGLDAYYTYRLREIINARFIAVPDIKRNFVDIQMPMLLALLAAEHVGILIDTDGLREYGKTVDNDLRDLDDRLPTGINWQSPAQVDTYFYTTARLPRPPFKPKRKDASGQKIQSKYQTDEACLLWLAMEQGNEVAKLLLQRREKSKLKGTYVEPILAITEETGGVLYYNFNQTVARTGRLSSSDPINMQNQPSVMRQFYRARPGFKFVVADYKQVELRLLAHYSQDSALLKAFHEGRDLHQETVDMLGLEQWLPKKQARTSAKRANFGYAYGVWIETYRRQVYVDTEGNLALSPQQAKDILVGLQTRYHEAETWKKAQTLTHRQRGYARTLDGRLRRLPHITSNNWGIRAYAERQGINVLIQGGVADIIDRALVRLSKFRAKDFRLQVHDEVVYEVRDGQLEFARNQIKCELEKAASYYKLSVPIEADIFVGDTWACKE